MSQKPAFITSLDAFLTTRLGQLLFALAVSALLGVLGIPTGAAQKALEIYTGAPVTLGTCPACECFPAAPAAPVEAAPAAPAPVEAPAATEASAG